jgi:hypothetical protein
MRWDGYAGRFEVYDGRNLPDGPFELVVSFQVIEHVPNPDPWLAEIARVGRRAMFATPNRIHRLREGQRPWNRYHVREYTADELRAELTAHFAEVTIWGVRASARSRYRARPLRPARKLARLDPLGLRYRLPPQLDAWCVTGFETAGDDGRTSRSGVPAPDREVEDALVLIAEAR